MVAHRSRCACSLRTANSVNATLPRNDAGPPAGPLAAVTVLSLGQEFAITRNADTRNPKCKIRIAVLAMKTVDRFSEGARTGFKPMLIAKLRTGKLGEFKELKAERQLAAAKS